MESLLPTIESHPDQRNLSVRTWLVLLAGVNMCLVFHAKTMAHPSPEPFGVQEDTHSHSHGEKEWETVQSKSDTANNRALNWLDG